MTIRFRRSLRRPIVTILHGRVVARIAMDRDEAECLQAELEGGE